VRDAAGATSAASPEHDTESPKAAELDDGVPTIVIRTSDAGEEFGHDGRHDAPPSVVASTPVDEPPPPPSPGLLRALEKMRSVFHIRDLRPGQAEIIESVLAGRDTLAIMPTGSGKSLTYQLPALVLEGPTLVVSPLLALIEDQYSKLKAAGVEVVRIDSTRTAKERAADLAAVREGTIKLVMITPESVK
jgi:superfamily II DNA helicase RecQ